MEPGIAAGHPATAAAGAEILAAGRERRRRGGRRDARVVRRRDGDDRTARRRARDLLGCRSGRAWNLDCFCAVPSGEGGDLVELQVPFGEELVHYAIGPASFAVPGVPAGLGALHARYGRLPWRELFEPALRLARAGVEMPPAQASCLAMLAPVMTMDAGARIYAPDGVLLQAGDVLRQPGLEKALALLADEGAASVYTGSLAQSLLSLMRQRGGAVTAHDLSTYEARWSDPLEVAYAGRTRS